MKTLPLLIPFFALALPFTGCVTPRSTSEPLPPPATSPSPAPLSEASQGRAVFQHMQAAVSEASEVAEDSLAFVQLQMKTSSGGRTITIGGTSINTGGGGRNKSYAGLVLDPEGHILVASHIKADDLLRATIWINDEEFPAHLVKTEEELGLSIFKIKPEAPLSPIDFKQVGTLVPGAWSVALSPSGEDKDFAKTRDIGFCSGVEESQFTTYLLHSSRLMTGAPVMNIEGQIAGIATASNKALAMTDLAVELKDLLARVKTEEADDSKEAEENDKGWLGVFHAPVNPDYARKYGLPRGGILINHVVKDGPADQAGVKAGDLVVQINGKDVRFSGMKAVDYFLKVLRSREGKAFQLTVVRKQERKELTGIFGKAPEPDSLRIKALGVDVRNIDPALVVSSKLSTDLGVYVNEIEKGSPAAMGGKGGLLFKGDVITAIAGTATPDLDSFSNAMEKIRSEEPSVVLVAYTRGRMTGFAALNLGLGEKQ